MPDPTAYLPLRITFDVVTPWCPPALGLHLDGLIGWALVKEAESEGRFIEDYDAVLADLPFDRHETPSGWVWKASFVRPTHVHGTELRYMTAKTATEEFARRMVAGTIEGKPLTTIDTVRGPYKNAAEFYHIEHVDRCVAYCVGDPERIAPLLDQITHLGRRARLDHGRIGSFAVDEDEQAVTLWRQRHMPEPENGHQPIMGRLQPPYWMGEGRTHVWRPL